MTRTKNIELSEWWGKQIKAKSKQCWRNAFNLAACLREEDVYYVEGWIRLKENLPFPIEHGWVEWGDEILDPTLLSGEVVYYSGVRYTKKDITEKLTLTTQLPLVWCGEQGGMENIDYRSAFHSANGE